MNSHDGTGAIKAAMTPIRVVCQNTLNLALHTAKRSWSTNHMGEIYGKLQDARDSLLYAEQYMTELGKTIDTLKERNYVELIEKKFAPTEIGVETTDKLQEFFSDLINVKYTADMEDDLDKIADMLIMINNGRIIFQEEKDFLLDKSV